MSLRFTARQRTLAFFDGAEYVLRYIQTARRPADCRQMARPSLGGKISHPKVNFLLTNQTRRAYSHHRKKKPFTSSLELSANVFVVLGRIGFRHTGAELQSFATTLGGFTSDAQTLTCRRPLQPAVHDPECICTIQRNNIRSRYGSERSQRCQREFVAPQYFDQR